MIDLYKLYKFFKEQWLGSILIIVWIISVFIYQHKRNELLNKAYILETKIKELEKKAKVELKSVDSLKAIDTIIVTRIKIIKQKEYEEIRVIDSLPISGLQSYFTERYPK
jgi:predicted nucleic acid-binding protein